MNMVNQQIVEQWRRRLAAWQQRLDEGRPRPWLARAYVRVLSYLLAQYAPQADPEAPLETIAAASQTEAATMPERSMMKFEAATPDLTGKPPRTRGDIRSVLEAVKVKVPHVQQGPLADGLHPDDPIVVAAFYGPHLASGLQTMLAIEGIESNSKRFRRQTQVIVRAGDLARAQSVLASRRVVARDTPRYRREYSGAFLLSVLILAALIGTLAGSAVAIAVNWNPFAPLGLVLGAFCGLLVWAISVVFFDPA